MDYLKDYLAASGTEPQTIRVEYHTDDGDGTLYIWGEDHPSTELEDFGAHQGKRIFVDGKCIFNDLKVLEDEKPGHDDEACEVCAVPIGAKYEP